jgi:hypothetical protein
MMESMKYSNGFDKIVFITNGSEIKKVNMYKGYILENLDMKNTLYVI